uniref:Iridoid synthase-like protein n=1 Tax=Antirrhinum majus TaxID=4151 RepID=A0A221J5P0_ANTMA|nr:iridoid synthase-like protein [Antirrhinum majus]
MGSIDAKYRYVAAIFGLTGLVGTELARKLLSTREWKVYGIARRPNDGNVAIEMESDPNYHFISCDLLNSCETQEKLSGIKDLTHVFWITWASEFPLDSVECSDQNKAMMSNALNAILPMAKELRHVSLQTGLKHYVSLQGNLVKSTENGDTLFDEHFPRVTSGHNFYYALEDLLQERLPRYKVAWSIHRPGLIMGCSKKTLYNFIGSLCVYGTICKYLNLPFVFGGTKQCWEEMCVDASDARLVAEQHIWAATEVETGAKDVGQAFNSINGVNYTWKEIWRAIGIKLGAHVSEENMFSEDFVFSSALGDKGGVWEEIVAKEGLVETKMEDLANWGFIDILFRCPVKMLGTRDKADCLGLMTRYHALDSICYWIDVMRAEKFIP